MVKQIRFFRESFLVFIIALLTSFAVSAQVTDTIVSLTPSYRNVLLEEYTGVACQFCPDGHRIANELAATYPGRVNIINIHEGPYSYNYYTTQFGTALSNQTNLDGYPTGTINRHDFSGSGTALNRGYWAWAANQIMLMTSPVNIAAEGMLDYATRTLHVRVQLYYTGSQTVTSNALNLAIIQDNVLGPQYGMSYNPTQIEGDQYKHMHMLRHLVTGQWGETIYSISPGTLVEKTYDYVIPAQLGSPNPIDAVLSNLHFVAFVCEGHQEVLTSIEVPIQSQNLPPIDGYIVEATNMENVECNEHGNACFTFRNMGMNTVTSLTYTYRVNNGAVQTAVWNGNISTLNTDIINIPVFDLNLNANNTITVQVTAINGVNVNIASRTVSIKKNVYTGSGGMTFTIVTDRFASETTFSLFDPNGNVVLSGGPWGDLSAFGTTMHVFNFDPQVSGCYRLEVYDSYGDGINSGYGEGYFTMVQNEDNAQVFVDDGQFGSKATYMIDINTQNPPCTTVYNEFTAIACGSYEWNGANYTTSGDHTQSFTLSNGCDSVVTLHLTVVPAPTITISAIHPAICVGSSTTLSATVNASNLLPANFNYEWIVDGGTPIAGMTNTYNLTLNTVGTHTVQARVTQGNEPGCTSSLSNQVAVQVAEQPSWSNVSVLGSNGADNCFGDTVLLAATIQGGVNIGEGSNGYIQWVATNMNGVTSNVSGGSGGSTYDVPDAVGTCLYKPTFVGYLGSGCELTNANTVSVMVTVHALPTAMFTSGDGTVLCDNNPNAVANLNIAFTGVSPFTYSVMDDNQNIIANATTLSNNVTIPVIPSMTTTYHIEWLTDAYCENSALSNGANATVYVINCDEPQPPTVNTYPVTDITTTTASCGGEVTYAGTSDVTARGICWSTLQNPTVSDMHTNDGTGVGAFTSILTGLTPNTTYRVRAYATNSVGTSYGEEMTFTTLYPCNPISLQFFDTICESELPYIWNGTTYMQSGDYLYSHIDANGCIQVDTLHLIVNYSNTGDTTAVACYSFTWYGNTYTESGDYTSYKTNANGCDSLITLHLTVNYSSIGDTTAVACESFTWYGNTYTESGDYTFNKSNAFGCDSLVTLHLTVNYSSIGDTTAVACESFTWYGNTYTESGDYTFYKTNANGCDSLVTLHLIVNNSNTGDTTAVACESFTWYGNTYTESGDYAFYKTNANGCDSLVTLHLTVNYSSTGDTTAVACDSFTWYGNTYTESGDYTFYKTNAIGCDSLVTLHLTIVAAPELQAISGESEVCRNQFVTYRYDILNPNNQHRWFKDNALWAENVPTVTLHETNEGIVQLTMQVLDEHFGCVADTSLYVHVMNSVAPDTTEIRHKQNSNILFCQPVYSEYGEVHYRWGYTDRYTFSEVVMSGDHNYCLYDFGIDTLSYYYWVETFSGNSAVVSCFNRSYYGHAISTAISEYDANVVEAYFLNDYIMLHVNAISPENVTAALYDVNGKLLITRKYGITDVVSDGIPMSIAPGIYFLKVGVGSQFYSVKLFNL